MEEVAPAAASSACSEADKCKADRIVLQKMMKTLDAYTEAKSALPALSNKLQVLFFFHSLLDIFHLVCIVVFFLDCPNSHSARHSNAKLDHSSVRFLFFSEDFHFLCVLLSTFSVKLTRRPSSMT